MEVGKHGISGACRPVEKSPMYRTFSLGVFEWVPNASGKGLKKSAVKVRVSGPTHLLEAVDRMAQDIAASLDAGTYTGPKHVRVG